MNFVNVNNEYEKLPELKDHRDEIWKIVEWVKQQPHLPDLEEREVILFFHACRYHTEITKQTIDLNYTTKTLCPEFFGNFDPLRDEMQQAMKVISIIHLKSHTPEGHKVVIGKLCDFDATKFVYADALKLYFMCFELILAEEGVASGFRIVIDLTGTNLGHVARLGLLTMKKFLFFLQEATAIRIAGFHYINLVPFVDKILALMKPFMKEELLSVLHLHSSMDTFYEFVPLKILPSEYGGQEEHTTIIQEKFYKKLMDNREFFLKDEKTRRVNEKLRPGKPKNASDIFGPEGNFRQLVID